MKLFKGLAATLLTMMSGAAYANTVTAYDNEALFQAAIGGATVIDTSANIGDTTEQLSIETPGATFFGPSSFVRFDALIPNGQGFFGPTTPHIGLNFDVPVLGVGAFSNAFDGGRIQAYSGLNGGGDFLGEVNFGSAGNVVQFGGITVNVGIMSVIFTCDFNFDLACGVIDPQFGGTPSVSNPVPVPAALPLFLAGLAGLGLRRARRS